MNDLSLYLAAARTLLATNVKSVAGALQLSDKTVTQMEKDADPDDPRVQRLIVLYEDLGVQFQRKGGEISGLSLTSELRKLRFNFSKFAKPHEMIQKFKNRLRHIRGIIVHTSLFDKNSASPKDTIDVHFPIETRDLVVSLLSRWIIDEGEFQQLDSNSKLSPVRLDNIEAIIKGAS